MLVRVVIIHPSIGPKGRWIDDFVDSAAGYQFEKIGFASGAQDWHARGARTTGREWARHFRQAYRAMTSGSDVVVANFPQLIMVACLCKAVLIRSPRVVGWSFNFGGAAKSGLTQKVARLFRRAAVLVTHSRAEIPLYSQLFGLPAAKLRFVPLQCGTIRPESLPQVDRPAGDYLIAMGSAGRDYASLFAALRGFDLPVLVIAKDDAVGGLERPAAVEVRSGLTLEQCWALAAGGRAMALPMVATGTASGQVTFLAAMALGVPIVATRCPGTEDYLTDGQDALLVPPGDSAALRRAIDRVMTDDPLRDRLASAARRTWQDVFSDEAAALNLVAVLDDVTRDMKPADLARSARNT